MISNSAAQGGSSLLWQPLFEAAAQTIVGAIATYAYAKVKTRFFQANSFDGALDLWQRGLQGGRVGENDSIRFDGLISPYAQLFPGDPFDNASRWNTLYSFPGKISSAEYQSMEFFAGSDASLRVGSLNGETIVGLYARYGFVGEGMIGVVPTKLILRAVPDFFHPDNIGVRAIVKGRIARCPSQHGFVAQAIALRAGIPFHAERYKNLFYLQISSVQPFDRGDQSTACLLGSVWATTTSRSEQYITQYGYLSNTAERRACVSALRSANSWKRVRVYFDDIDCPSESLSFKKRYF